MTRLNRTYAAIAVSAALIAVGCGDDDEQESAASTPPPSTTADDRPASNARLDEVLKDPARFVGDIVTIRGEADGATSAPAAFRVIRSRGPEQGIVVLATRNAGAARSVVTGEEVTVTGEVLEVTPDLADKADFLFESDRNASNTVDRIETEYVLAANEVGVS